MKYIFITLVVANLAYFGYSMWAGEPELRRAPASTVNYPDGVEPVFLLSENDDGQEREAQLNLTIANPVREQEQEEEPAEGCLALGPFSDLFSGQAVSDQLGALDVVNDLRAVDRETGDSDYRVMIPPSPSLQDAFRKLRELKSQDIDSYVITQGKDSLGISLGVFSTQQAAQTVQTRRSREGYDSVIVEIPRLSREYWIYGASGDLALDPELWTRLASENDGVGRQRRNCPEMVESAAEQE